jgi:[ribosomal protein S5]-alanine N-acetyltransferase
VDVPTIRAPRLDLASMSPPFLEALIARRLGEAEALLGARLPPGWPDEDVERLLRLRLKQMLRDPEAQQWLVRAVVLREPERVMVGHAGFHGPPGVNGPGQPRALEVGYTVFTAYRGRGFATEAVVALLQWAGTQGIRHFVASVGPQNEPSLAIVRKLGFVRTGEQWDEEDGLELVFELAPSSPAAGRG